MKSVRQIKRTTPSASLPVWGEWIEMRFRAGSSGPVGSLPVWGEWIEIISQLAKHRRAIGLSPCGESGLKYRQTVFRVHGGLSLPVWGEWIEIMALPPRLWEDIVSPRVGRVD